MRNLFQRLFRRSSISADVSREIETHVAMRAELNEESGMTHDEAYASARRQFGNSTAVRERVYDLTGFGWLDTLRRNLVYALRGIRRQPGVSASAVLTIAIGIGAVTGMFSVTQNLILAPPPHVSAPDRVFKFRQVFWIDGGEGEPGGATSYPFFELLSERARTLESLGAYADTTLPVGSGIDAEMAEVVMVSPGFWETLGTRPEIGRFIDDSEAHPATGARVVVLGHAFWQVRLGGDPGIVGQTLEIHGQPYTIVGIAPRGFRGVELQEVDLWLPLFTRDDGSGRPVTWHTISSSYTLRIVLRLREGASPAQSSAELTNLQRAFLEETYAPIFRDASVERMEPYRRSRSLLGPLTGGLGDNLRPIPEARVTVWLLGVAVVFILIASANVAGLLLLRTLRRRREIAVRLAVGIGRRELALQLLTESSVVAVLGGTAAILAQIWAGAWLQRTLLPAMAWEPSAVVHPSVLSVAAASMVGTALVAGMAPLYFLRAHPLRSFREGPSAAMTRRPRMHGVLVAVQGALSVVLLVGAGLFLRSLYNLETANMGLDRENVLVVQVDFSRFGRDTGHAAFFERALERISVLPGVSRASVSRRVPLRVASAGSFAVDRDQGSISSPRDGVPFSNAVTPGFFQTTGMRIVEGRAFVEADRLNGRVVIVNESLARLAWPDQSPIGRCSYVHVWPDECATVVGVVGDARTWSLVEDDVRAYFYTPLLLSADGPRALLVRTADGVGRNDSTIRDALYELDSGLPYIGIEALGDVLDPQIRPWRLGASVFTAFGILAVLLAVIGLWSSVSYAASQRRQEFAIRLAVGESRETLLNRVLGDGLRNAVVSVAAGVLIAGLASSFIADLLFDVSPHDPLVFGTIAGVILVVATLASLFPAWRAANVRPADALRAD